MSTFSVKVCKIRSIEPIENADAVELAVIGDYRSVVKKGLYEPGNLIVYIPEQSIVPQWILEQLNLVGKLAGPENNRVKAVKIRGALSQGIVYPLSFDTSYDDVMKIVPVLINDKGERWEANEGDDVAEFLGITKWEPPIPVFLAGEVYNAGTHITVPYDIENFKNYPDILQQYEEVVMTEKLHGSFVGVGILPENDWSDQHFRRKFVIFSKGLGAKGLCFKDNEKNQNNVYIKTLSRLQVFEKLESYINMITEDGGVVDAPTFILGEVFGKGVQDLSYDCREADFRAFDIVVGYRGNQVYYDYSDMTEACRVMEIKTVPLVYRGPFNKDTMLQHTKGAETLSGKQTHIREGVVVKPVKERAHPEIGRVILKSVSEDYLLRKGGTEFN